MFAISEMQLSGSMSPGGAAPASAYKMEAICPKVNEADKEPSSPQGPMDGEEGVRYNGEVDEEHRGDTEGQNSSHSESDGEEGEDPDSEPALVISEEASLDFDKFHRQNPQAPQTSSSSVRRNKRKDFKPRNIVSYSYESEEMEEGSEVVEDGGSGDDEAPTSSAEQPLDLAKRTLWARRCERESTPMDLSVRGDFEDDDEDDEDEGAAGGSSPSGGDGGGGCSASEAAGPSLQMPASNGHEDPTAAAAAAVMDLSGRMAAFFSPYAHQASARSPEARRAFGTSPADASAMKEYAESTMKELLSMYGLNDVAESITKNVPIANFASGKILETFSSGKGMIPGLSSLQMASLPPHLHQHLHQHYPPYSSVHHHPLQQPPNSPPHHNIPTTSSSSSAATPPAQPPTPPRTPHTPKSTHSPSPQSPTHQHPHQQHHQHQPPVSAAALAALGGHPHDGLYVMQATKAAADTMGKMAAAGLSPNSLLGAPPRQMMLPDNMARILALAAFQEQVHGVGSSPVDHKTNMTNSPHPGVPTGSHLAVGSLTSMGPTAHLGTPRDPSKQAPIDYTRYVKRFANAAECGSAYCKDLNYREHFHCLDCNSRVFIKKEEMIRHFKWHKKRDESLQHGFMRYSPMDDCLDRFRNCNHNRKQTHYHCLQEGCDKVYISTSDVQMHANYHRKDSAIIQEGFQRFRATEDCSAAYCSFFGQRTTHFHCRRPGCKYTFKNKADMEKHKSYHIKDEQLIKDGFKKFMKHEYCCFENCRFSRVCNHIHCIRPGCSYVLHSSGQLYSHKRKHERKDNELAYRKFKLAQSMMKTMGDGHSLSISPVAMHHISDQLSQHEPSAIQTSVIQGPVGVMSSSSMSSSSSVGTTAADPTNKDPDQPPPPPPPIPNGLPIDTHSPLPPTKRPVVQHPYAGFASLMTGLDPSGVLQYAMPPTAVPPSLLTAENLAAMDLTNDMLKAQQEEIWKKYLTRYAPHDKCRPECEFQFKDHYHCHAEGCDMAFRSKDGVREHARNHEQQDQVTASFYNVTEAGQEPCQCPTECPHQNRLKHYHCTWDNCREVILPTDKPFRRLDHYKMHEYSRKLNMSKDPMTMTLTTSIDGLFKRKRGRPPKNRVIEVWNDYFPMSASHGLPDMPQAIFTSFKLPKPMMPMPCPSGQGMMPTLPPMQPEGSEIPGFSTSPSHSPLGIKPMMTIPPHFMTHPTSAGEPSGSPTGLKMEVQEGFYVFANGSPCPDLLCPTYGKQHFHCSQPRCFYVTDKEEMLIMHSKDFHDNIDIMEGFVFFDRTIDCRHPACPSNKVNRHFHCTRPGCGFTFVRYSTMAVHEQTHKDGDGGESGNPPDSSAPSQSAATATPNVDNARTRDDASPRSSHSPQPPPTSDTPPKITVVKAAGTYYPLSAFPTSLPQGKVVKCESNTTSTATSPISSNPSSPQLLKPGGSGENGADDYKQNVSAMEAMMSADQHALTKLLQQPSPEMHRFDWSLLDRPTKYGPEQSCGRPFCKLKRKEHYHCHACNQAFSELEKLKPHIQKHSSGALSPNSSRREAEEDSEKGSPMDSQAQDESSDSSSPQDILTSMKYEMSRHHMGEMQLPPHPPPPLPHPSMPPHTAPPGFPEMLGSPYALLTSQGIPLMQHGIPALYTTAGGMMFATPTLARAMPAAMKTESTPVPSQCDAECSSTTPGVMGKRVLPQSQLDMSPEAKKARIQSSMRILKDEPVPDGYIRFRFNEDCKYPHCGYREHQTHFHCIRKDCGYSFCDKTRFVQHTARHERLDTLMGGDFQQFRANVPCGRFDCIYTSTLGTMQNKASHFHCLKCDFVCTDTNKVVAHRRQHQKLDSIMAAGFEKFTPSQNCSVEGCAHNQKQTHYHCLKCHYAVLGLSQMSAHKYRHLE